MVPTPVPVAWALAARRSTPEGAAPAVPPDAAERRDAGVDAAGTGEGQGDAGIPGPPPVTPEQDLGLAFARARAMLEWIAHAAGVMPGDGAGPSCGPAARPSADEP